MARIDDDALELEARRVLYDLILGFHGLHMREIQRKTGMSIALVEYHLNSLEGAELISSVEDGGYKRYFAEPRDKDFPGFRISHQDKRVIGVLRQRVPLQVALLLLRTEWASLKEISDSLGMAPSKLSFHLKKMLAVGIAVRTPRAEGKGYALGDRAGILRLLVTFKPPQDMLEEFSELWDSIGEF